ncbi:helix-turn-helix domain-containing protein [Paenibacillus mesophilus]|uniref:helix-turn-helix domain-containing protein n=1 Tax=Paenibacillus mesophilus TaxID=2582849 RepID=UPI0013050EFC|nr:helix-turn-helix domain-containing protein [Paenibacillus mesophilus]
MSIEKWRYPARTNRLYFRILSYFLFLLVPTLIIGAGIYAANVAIFKEQTIDKISSNLISSSKSIDNVLRTTEQTGMNFLMNDTVQRYLVPYSQQSVDEREKTSSIIKWLASNRNIVSPYIDDMFVYTDSDWVYKSDGMESFHSFFTQFSRFADYGDRYWADLLRSDFSLRVLEPTEVRKSFKDGSERVVPFVLSQYIAGNRVVLVATVSASKIDQFLIQNRVVGSSAFLVTDQNHRVVAGSSEMLQPSVVKLLTDAMSDTDNGNAELKLDKRPSVVTVYRSEYGWNYYSITPTTEYTSLASGILSLIKWMSVILIVLGIVFSFIFSNKLYNPIRNLIDAQHRREKFSGEFLENAFTYVLNGNRLSKHEALMQEIGFENGQYVCVGIKFHFKDAFYQDIQDTDRLLVLESMKKIIQGILQRHVSAYVIDVQKNLYAAMVNLKEEKDRSALDQALALLMETFNYDTKYCRLVVGVGRIYEHIGDLAKSYGDSRIALAKADEKIDCQIIDASRFPLEQYYQFGFVEERKVLNALRSGDMTVLEAEIRAIVDVNLEKGTSHWYMNLLLVELYNIGVKFLMEKGISPERMLTESDHQILVGKSSQLLDLQEHLALLLRFCREIVESATTQEDNKAAKIVIRMIDYIDANYMNDLYLEQVASEMNLSAKYISKLFKESTGTNLTEYISIKRIAEAKKLLMSTAMKNDEIAEKVGIVSRSTFFRLFKKYEGITPQDYRKMLQDGIVSEEEPI